MSSSLMIPNPLMSHAIYAAPWGNCKVSPLPDQYLPRAGLLHAELAVVKYAALKVSPLFDKKVLDTWELMNLKCGVRKNDLKESLNEWEIKELYGTPEEPEAVDEDMRWLGHLSTSLYAALRFMNLFELIKTMTGFHNYADGALMALARFRPENCHYTGEADELRKEGGIYPWINAGMNAYPDEKLPIADDGIPTIQISADGLKKLDHQMGPTSTHARNIGGLCADCLDPTDPSNTTLLNGALLYHSRYASSGYELTASATPGSEGYFTLKMTQTSPFDDPLLREVVTQRGAAFLLGVRWFLDQNYDLDRIVQRSNEVLRKDFEEVGRQNAEMAQSLGEATAPFDPAASHWYDKQLYSWSILDGVLDPNPLQPLSTEPPAVSAESGDATRHDDDKAF